MHGARHEDIFARAGRAQQRCFMRTRAVLWCRRGLATVAGTSILLREWMMGLPAFYTQVDGAKL